MESPLFVPKCIGCQGMGKFHYMQMNIDFRSSILIGEEDAEIETTRAAFIKATLGLWEQQWLDEGAKSD
jgi:hypothetical protein